MTFTDLIVEEEGHETIGFQLLPISTHIPSLKALGQIFLGYHVQLLPLSSGATINLSLGNDGSVSGTPTTISTNSFTVRVEDAQGDSDEQALTIIIDSEPNTETLVFNPVDDAYLESGVLNNNTKQQVWNLNRQLISMLEEKTILQNSLQKYEDQQKEFVVDPDLLYKTKPQLVQLLQNLRRKH